MEYNTLFIGQEIKILDKIDSTNSYALDLIRNSAPAEGYVIRALEQNAGRGQRNKQWLSEPGANLTFSIILHPKFLKATEQFQLTKAIALGIIGFLSQFPPLGGGGAIKWPNDIYIHNSKIAGILIENILEKSFLKHSVVGIGLNVNQTEFDPALPNPTSLKQECGREFDTMDCLKQLCSFIEKYYLILRSGNHAQLDEEYHQLLYKRGIWSTFSLQKESFTGKIEGVNKTGELIIQKQSGERIEVSDVRGLGWGI